MTENTSRLQEAKEERLRRARILATEISDAAMAILREYTRMDYPVFQDCETLPDGRAVPQDLGVLTMRASYRDGAQSVIKWIERMRRDAKS